jgi:hypothetical protein
MAQEDQLIAIARFMELGRSDAEGHDAVEAAVSEAAEPKPRGIIEGAIANFILLQGGFKNTELGKRRRQQVAYDKTVLGAIAYTRGAPGNSFTRFLVRKLGRYDGPPLRISWKPDTRSEAQKAIGEALAPLLKLPLFAGLSALLQSPAKALSQLARSSSVKGNLRFFVIYNLGVLAAALFLNVARPRTELNTVIGGYALAVFLLSLAFVTAAFFVERGRPFKLLSRWLGHNPPDADLDRELSFVFLVGAPFGGFVAGCLLYWVSGLPQAIALGCGLGIVPAPTFLFVPYLVDRKGRAEISREVAAPPAGSMVSPRQSTAASSADTLDDLLSAEPPANEGGLYGDRFGRKVFRAILDEVSEATDLLYTLATLQSQLRTVPKWRIDPNPKPMTSLDWEVGDNDGLMKGAIGEKYLATTGYRWDGTTHVAVRDGQAAMVGLLPDAKAASGSGELMLECAAARFADSRLTVVQLVFSEVQAPMWMHRQAEELVAKTLTEMAEAIEQALHHEIAWTFRCGDWIHSQLVQTAQGEIWLKRARG